MAKSIQKIRQQEYNAAGFFLVGIRNYSNGSRIYKVLIMKREKEVVGINYKGEVIKNAGLYLKM